ncbi:MAG: PASTA domain-containing protein [Salinivirgaceae bacterium]
MRWLRIFKKKVFWKTLLYAAGLYLIIFLLITLGLRIYTHHGKSFPVPDFKGLDSIRVKELANYNNLLVEVVDSTFIPYLTKGSVIDQYPQPGIKVKKNRTIFLTINAFNQAKVEMPNVVGVSYRQGKTTLESRGLKVGRLIYQPDFAKNNILKQQYKGKVINAGTMIEKGELIDLVLGNGLGQSSVSVPDLKKLKYNRALNEINDAYFNVGNVVFDTTVHTFSDSINAMVWRQYPGNFGNSRAVMGSRIDIWLTLNPELFPADTANVKTN